MFHILIIDDDENFRRQMNTVLKPEGYIVFEAGNGEEALKVMDHTYVDLVISETVMPRMDGYEFIVTLRHVNIEIPVIIVTAKQLPADRRLSFLAGADDLMTKPVDTEELLMRVRALLRRAKMVNKRKIRIGDVTVDYDAHTVSRGNEVQDLPTKEFLLLYQLLSYPQKIHTREQLMDEIWGEDNSSNWQTLTVHIGRLRKRFKGWPEFEIKAVRGLGYKAVIHGENITKSDHSYSFDL